MEDKQVKILYFVDRMMKAGIQTLVVDIVRKINKKKFKIDFLLLDDGNTYKLEEELMNLGCTIYKLKGIWVKTGIDFIKYVKAVDNFFKEHNDYQVVHMHSSSKNYIILKKAKKYGIKRRIAHSHNIDFQTRNIFKKIIGNLFKIKLIKYATDYYACSKIAGSWLFGNKLVKDGKVKVIPNAIDYDKFKFNLNMRNKIRKELGIKDNEILVGHIGRFVNQKNHVFLIKIFQELYKYNSNYKLLLIGNGPKENKIIKKIRLLNLENNVLVLGFKNNVQDYMNAMDLFVFPSKFEGLGLVLVEAQANGLQCYASKEVIPLEAKVSRQLTFIDLNNNNYKLWAKNIIQKFNYTRTDVKNEIAENKYLIENTVELLEKEYLKDNI
ncbi:MAG TPA: glycosyltransferase family 1 protein [Candidatus Scatovivens faecipullorum]|nr:glycosyltransferase family 1 protein [Candidatus Scatovivens faecipullorum]